MSIGIVSNEDFFRELVRLCSPSDNETRAQSDVVPSIESIPSRGRSEGDTNVPDSLRKIIAEEQLFNGRQSALGLAKEFGISASSVSAYAKGASSTTTYNKPKESIISHINRSRARATKRASKTLNQALESITQEKLDYSDAKDLSAIAKDMSVIIKNLEPPVPNESESKAAPQFVIYAPQFKKEESFEVITVNE